MDSFTEMLSMQYYLRDKLLGFNYSEEGETEETAQRHEQYDVLVAKLVSQATKEGVQTTQSFPLL
jgi:hypothetical protein